jgi:hypothetical protein
MEISGHSLIDVAPRPSGTRAPCINTPVSPGSLIPLCGIRSPGATIQRPAGDAMGPVGFLVATLPCPAGDSMAAAWPGGPDMVAPGDRAALPRMRERGEGTRGMGDKDFSALKGRGIPRPFRALWINNPLSGGSLAPLGHPRLRSDALRAIPSMRPEYPGISCSSSHARGAISTTQAQGNDVARAFVAQGNAVASGHNSFNAACPGELRRAHDFAARPGGPGIVAPGDRVALPRMRERGEGTRGMAQKNNGALKGRGTLKP